MTRKHVKFICEFYYTFELMNQMSIFSCAKATTGKKLFKNHYNISGFSHNSSFCWIFSVSDNTIYKMEKKNHFWISLQNFFSVRVTLLIGFWFLFLRFITRTKFQTFIFIYFTHGHNSKYKMVTCWNVHLTFKLKSRIKVWFLYNNCLRFLHSITQRKKPKTINFLEFPRQREMKN